MQLQIRLSKTMAVALCLGFLVLVAGCGRQKRGDAAGNAAPRRVLTLYVPCGMELPFMELCKIFEARHPDVSTNLLLDNSNVLARRASEKHEKPDAIVSPGSIEMAGLIEAGYVKKEDLTHFGKYELVLFGPRDNPGNIHSFADLTGEAVKIIAVADPDTTSVGYYTRETLRNLGLWDKVKSKVLFTADPSMAYKHVARAKAQASFAYRSCPLKTAPDKLAYSKVRIIESVPDRLYGPAYATIALLKDSPNRDLGAEFVKLLRAKEGQAILARYELPCLGSSEPASTKTAEDNK